ncbi:uncharacterized protein LOC130368702 isoform X3 [Hyla sarda]|uniref:uncharacterized protein LOC130368702 isoform X3 n=1 Tax=Hyla sarda TaxID=327740 RepID=UPI0024C3D07A|nr:uncharacterized protein LOC130368702 isoform X3 [Hyla sarda]
MSSINHRGHPFTGRGRGDIWASSQAPGVGQGRAWTAYAVRCELIRRKTSARPLVSRLEVKRRGSLQGLRGKAPFCYRSGKTQEGTARVKGNPYSKHMLFCEFIILFRISSMENSKRRKRSKPPKGTLEETFSIRSRRGKRKAERFKPAYKKKKISKQLKEKQENQLVKERRGKKYAAEKKIKESIKDRKSSETMQNELEFTKDHMSNDLEAKEIQDTSTTELFSRKINHTGELLKADEKEHVEATVCRQPDSGSQSGRVTRQTRAVRFVGHVKPVAYDLDVTDTESGAEEENCSAEGDEPSVSSAGAGEKCRHPVSKAMQVLPQEPYILLHLAHEGRAAGLVCERELLKRCSITFDPETRSDKLLECIAQSEMSTFLGDESCKSWFNLNNCIFNTGKMIIAPKKKSQRRILLLDILVTATP